jgi:hypothetical protein
VKGRRRKAGVDLLKGVSSELFGDERMNENKSLFMSETRIFGPDWLSHP